MSSTTRPATLCSSPLSASTLRCLVDYRDGTSVSSSSQSSSLTETSVHNQQQQQQELSSSYVNYWMMDPVPWGTIGTDQVALMTPPVHVLLAATTAAAAASSFDQRNEDGNDELSTLMAPPPNHHRPRSSTAAASSSCTAKEETAEVVAYVIVMKRQPRRRCPLQPAATTTAAPAAVVRSALPSRTTTTTTGTVVPAAAPQFRLVIDDDDKNVDDEEEEQYDDDELRTTGGRPTPTIHHHHHMDDNDDDDDDSPVPPPATTRAGKPVTDAAAAAAATPPPLSPTQPTVVLDTAVVITLEKYAVAIRPSRAALDTTVVAVPTYRLLIDNDEPEDDDDDDQITSTTTTTTGWSREDPPRRSSDSNDASTTITTAAAATTTVQFAKQPELELFLEKETTDEDEDCCVIPVSGTSTLLPAKDEQNHPSRTTSTTFNNENSRSSNNIDDEEDDDATATATTTTTAAASKMLLQQLLVASERQSRKLERQLRQSGVAVISNDDISYAVARQKIETIAARMNEIGPESSSNAEYFALEQEMEKYNTAIVLTDEYHQEQNRVDQEWERTNAAKNAAALDLVRRHMPVEIRRQSVQELVDAMQSSSSSSSSNVAADTVPIVATTAIVPIDLLKRFKRTNGITLLRVDPDAIERMHPSTLESLRTTGLTLTERRALYAHLRLVGDAWRRQLAGGHKLKAVGGSGDAMTERKYRWFTTLRNNFREAQNAYEAHVRQYYYCSPTATTSSTSNMPTTNSACRCPFPRTCPVVADALVGYTAMGTGQPATAEYELLEVMTSSSSSSPSQCGGASSSSSARDGTNVVAATTVTANIATSTTKHEAAEIAAAAKSKRREELRRHYKGNLRSFSDASVTCETMDDLVENMTYQTAQWAQQEADNADGVTLIGKMKVLSSEVKVALLGLWSTQRFRPPVTVVATTPSTTAAAGVATTTTTTTTGTTPPSPMEYTLLQQVCVQAVVLCDTIEARMKRLELQMVHADTKGTIITTSAIRLLVAEIVASLPASSSNLLSQPMIVLPG